MFRAPILPTPDMLRQTLPIQKDVIKTRIQDAFPDPDDDNYEYVVGDRYEDDEVIEQVPVDDPDLNPDLPSNPSRNLQRSRNIQQGLTQMAKLQPSQYLDQLKKLIDQKQRNLSDIASKVQKSVKDLETNIELMKNKLISLEEAKQKLEQDLQKNEQKQVQTSNPDQIQQLQQENVQIKQEISKIQGELDKNLNSLSDLENKLEQKENEWNKSKEFLTQKLVEFQEQELVPYLNKLEEVMSVTNARINASNDKLTQYLAGNFNFGSFALKEDNRELFTQDDELQFGEQEMNFGQEKTESETSSENNEMKFGEEIEEEEIEEEEIEEDSEDEDSEEEMEFGSDSEDDEEE